MSRKWSKEQYQKKLANTAHNTVNFVEAMKNYYDNHIAIDDIKFEDETPDNILKYVMDHCDREAQDPGKKIADSTRRTRMSGMLTALIHTESKQPNYNSRKDEVSEEVETKYKLMKKKYDKAAKEDRESGEQDAFQPLTAADTRHIINSIRKRNGIGGKFDSS